MNYQETKQKVLKLCDNLNKEGLLTEAELENCRRSFTLEGQEIDLELYKFAKTSKEFSFGMNDNQGVDVLYTDLTKSKLIKCFLASADKKSYLSVRPGIPNELYMAPNEITEDTQTYILFIIELQKVGKYAGTYTITNSATGNYMEVNQDKTVSALSNILNDNCFFKLAQSGPTQFLYTFESAKYPGKYLIADNPVAISGTGPKYWVIERINPETDIQDDNNALKKDETTGLIDNLLIKINSAKLNYYAILAQIEFLNLIKNKMLNLVKSQGDIMNNYFDKKDNRELDISEDLLKYIQFSINNEVRSREVSQIDDMINELIVEAERLKGEENDSANEKALKLRSLIDKQIESKKTQIASLNQMIESIGARQRDLNQQQDLIDNKKSKIKDKKDIIVKNYDLALDNDKEYKYELYYAIVAGIILLACVGFFGYQLWLRFSKEILGNKSSNNNKSK
jgi:hypothetical protein